MRALVVLVTIASPFALEARADAQSTPATAPTATTNATPPPAPTTQAVPAVQPPPPQTTDPTTGAPIDPDLVATSLSPAPAPPPLDEPYLQYGVALAAEVVTSAGKLCATDDPCVLGSGGGIVARVGRRSAGAWYFGGAYEITKQDPANLYRFATLQQLRGEARYYVVTGLDTQPFATAGLGVAGYGNEWGVDTWGPVAHLGVGVEAQLSRSTVVGVTLAYRVLYLKSFVDTSNLAREGGFAQIIGIELTVEGRDALARQGDSMAR